MRELVGLAGWLDPPLRAFYHSMRNCININMLLAQILDTKKPASSVMSGLFCEGFTFNRSYFELQQIATTAIYLDFVVSHHS